MLFSAKNSIFPTLLTLASVGGVTALAIQLYRHPRETMVSILRVGMRLIDIHEAICGVNGFPIHYYYAGHKGTPVILVHGLGSSAENWFSLLPFLQRAHRVYALDLPGFGKTPLAPEGVSIGTHVLYLGKFIETLGYPQVILVGNSLGGWIATTYAIGHPERVKHLYLLNSAGLMRENTNSPYAIDRVSAQRTFNHMFGTRFPMPGFVLDAMVRSSQMPAYKNFIHGYDPQEELDAVLEQVDVPTTIIWGERDGIFPLSCANDLHRGIANSELILLPKVGHMPHMQAPGTVARIINSVSG